MLRFCVSLCMIIGLCWADPTVHFEERFLDDSWKEKWIQSEHQTQEFGKFVHSHGQYYGDEVNDKGLQTSEDARYYGISAKFDPFSNKGKTLVVQFTVKHEQNIDCGGGYLKLFDCYLDPKDMHGETPYVIMFGPDICGPGTKKVHVIFNYQDQNHLINKDIRCKDDVHTHLYTLIVRPDNTYEVLIDNEQAAAGELEADWNFLHPKTIKDPEAKRPEDWDDRATIDNPEDIKPDDWEQAEHIPDADAVKPEDWDDEMDGEWEPPMVDNPDFKGEWKPKQIDNPKYKGQWEHPEIANPEYVPDSEIYAYPEICSIGFDLWQVKAGSIFDNVLITDCPEHAKKVGEEVWKSAIEGEKKMKEKQEEEERKRREEEAKVEKDKSGDDDEDEDDEEEEKNVIDEEVEPEEHDHDEL